MGSLTLRYEHSEGAGGSDPWADYGRLTVNVVNDRFAGQGTMTVLWQEVRTFAERLASYPIMEDAPVVAQWGLGIMEDDDLILRIEVFATDRLGGLLMRCEVADEAEPRERVRTSFPTGYAELDSFRRSLNEMMDRQVVDAVLRGRASSG